MSILDRPRTRRFRYLAPIQTHAICRKCHAPCCKQKSIEVAITLSEWGTRNNKRHPWRLNIYYSLDAVKRKTLTDGPARYLRVGGVRWRSGRYTYSHIEVHLAKKKNGSCVHVRSNGHCSIYAQRPHACKAWFCGRGTADDSMWQQLCEEEKNDQPT